MFFPFLSEEKLILADYQDRQIGTGEKLEVGPVFSYHYGVRDHGELKNLLKRSLVIIGIASVTMLVLSEVLDYPFCDEKEGFVLDEHDFQKTKYQAIT